MVQPRGRDGTTAPVPDVKESVGDLRTAHRSCRSQALEPLDELSHVRSRGSVLGYRDEPATFDCGIEAIAATTIRGEVVLIIVRNMPPEFTPHLLTCRQVSGSPIVLGSEREMEQEPVLKARHRDGCVDPGRRASRLSQLLIEAIHLGYPLVMIDNAPDLLLCAVLLYLFVHPFHQIVYGPGGLDAYTGQTEVGLECVKVDRLSACCFA